MIRLMSSSISADLAQDAATPRPRRHFPCSALVIAAVANALVPAVFFSVFLASSIRYARAIHPRLHLGGFFLGIAATFVPIYLYLRLLP